VQTFLPHPDFAETARALDQRRLGKQRVEVLQIVRALTRPSYGWKHHPAVLMWQGYEEALGAYGLAIVREWRAGGRADTCEASILADLAAAAVAVPPRGQAALAAAGLLPPWLGDEALHRSHRSALLRKDPAHYRPLFGDEPDDLDYVWPVRRAQTPRGRASGRQPSHSTARAIAKRSVMPPT
jgi:hypothetical protein